MQLGLFDEPARVAVPTARALELIALVHHGWHPYSRGLGRPLAIHRDAARGLYQGDLFPSCEPRCGSCVWLQPLDEAEITGESWATRTFKCFRYPTHVTRGRATDIRKGWPACTRYEPARAGAPEDQ